jgi:hypothetical protein
MLRRLVRGQVRGQRRGLRLWHAAQLALEVGVGHALAPAGEIVRQVAVSHCRLVLFVEQQRLERQHDPRRPFPLFHGRLLGRKRLGYWAQMLSMANGWIRSRVDDHGEKLENAVARFEDRLEKRGLTAFDPTDEKERNRAIRACVDASLDDLGNAERARFRELAILPEDQDVTLAVIAGLWAETGALDEDQSEELVERLRALSLLQALDLGARTLRLHDNMTWYLRESLGKEGLRAAHAAMIRAISAACEGIWSTLPASHTYGWRFLIRHLRGAGQTIEAESLLTNYSWIKAKFLTEGPNELFASYVPESVDEGARLIGRAIALSLPALAANPRELPRQLFGRLGSIAHPSAAEIVAATQADVDFHPAPRWPGLTPPGAEQLRLVAGPVNLWLPAD